MGAADTSLRVAEPDGFRVEHAGLPARPRGVGRDSALRRLLAGGDALAVMLALTIALVVPGLPAGGHRILWGVVGSPADHGAVQALRPVRPRCQADQLLDRR